MICPVCQSTMVSYSDETIGLTITNLGDIELLKVPVCRCYGGDHINYEMPKPKDIYQQVILTLATTSRALLRHEYNFLINCLHYNSPVYSRQLVHCDIDFPAWQGCWFDIQPQRDHQLLLQVINKLRQPQDQSLPAPGKPLRIKSA